MRNKNRRRVIWLLIGVLIAVSVGIWQRMLPPSVGGGKPDSLAARWVKGRIYAQVSALDEQGFTRLTAENANGWYGVFREPIQSLEYYQTQQPMRPTPTRRTIVLQPIGAMNSEQQVMLQALKDYSEAFFQLPVRIAAPLALELAASWTRPARGPNPSFSAGSGQYDAGKILSRILIPRLPDDAAAYLGITMADLWSDNLSYVFGLGSFDHRTGVYSLCRYFPEFWGQASRPKDRKQTLRRACQVLNHEAGHMFGLMHCVLYQCSMNGSNSLMDADRTPLEYCPVCHRKLLWNNGSNGSRRYRDLLKFYRKHGLGEEVLWTEARLQRWQQIEKSELANKR